MTNSYTLTAISTATTTNFTTGATFLHTVNVPKTTGGTITFQDRASSPATYFVLPASTIAGSYHFDAVLGNGLAVVTASADNVYITTSQ